MGFLLPWIIRPARVSIFFEDSFGLKRFQREGGVAGLGKKRFNRRVNTKETAFLLDCKNGVEENYFLDFY